MATENGFHTEQQPPPTPPSANGIEKVTVLMTVFGLSLGQVVAASGRSISKSQLHRVLRGQSPNATEKRAIALGLSQLVKERCDSAYLFDQAEGRASNAMGH